MTYNEVIKRALQRLAVLQTGDAGDGDQYLDGLHSMNEMVNGWRNKGVYLNFNNVEDTAGGDTTTFDDEDIAAVVDNLAVRLAPDYGKTITPVLAASASSGFSGLYAKYGPSISMRVDRSISPYALRRFGPRLSSI